MSITIANSTNDIIVSYVSGATTTLVQYLPKTDLKVVADYRRNVLYLLTDHTDFEKGDACIEIAFADVTTPSVATLADLVAQITAWSGTQTITDPSGNVLYPSGLPAKLSGTITRPADTNNYAAGDHILGYTAAVKKKVTVTLAGTSGTANVTVGGVTKLATFATDLTTTAANFVTAWAAAYLAAGIVLTSSTADLIFEASVAGVDFATGSTANVTTDLTGTHVVTTANVTLLPITLSDASIANGGGGFMMDFKMETDATQFAGATLRFWLFNDIPSGIVGDNVAYINSFANADKRCACAYFDCTFDALLAGSDCLIGKFQPNAEYVCATGSKAVYVLVQTLSAITTPKSAGVFKFYWNVVKIA